MDGSKKCNFEYEGEHRFSFLFPDDSIKYENYTLKKHLKWPPEVCLRSASLTQ